MASVQQLCNLAACVNTNAHAVFAPDSSNNADTGLGMFPALSMLNSSCRPNCSFYASGAGGATGYGVCMHELPATAICMHEPPARRMHACWGMGGATGYGVCMLGGFTMLLNSI